MYDEFFKIASSGDYKKAALLLSDKCFDPSARNNYALRCATRSGHTAIVKLLLSDDRVDLSDSRICSYAIIKSANNGYTDIVRLLLSDDRIDPAVENNYALRIAERNGHFDIVKLLKDDPRVQEYIRKNTTDES